jgi:hypothetical protein
MTSMSDLGPATEALLAQAYADRLLLTAKATAQLLGIDPRTLSTMTDDLVIRATPVGRIRRYAEVDVRAYLASAKVEAPSGRSTRVAGRSPATKIMSFTEMRRRGLLRRES